MRRSTMAAAVPVAAAALALAACGSNGSSTSADSSGGGQAPASTPAAVTWHVGGTYTGPVPPGGPMPSPLHTWQLNSYTSPDGYRLKDSITFSVPLHYAIPRLMQDCYGGYQGGSEDLPPGQFVVPFEIRITNLLGQQSRAIGPDVWAGDGNGNATIDITGGDKNGNDTSALWANGDCSSEVSHTIGAGSSDALFGFIGPATPEQLAKTYIYVTWINDPQAPPQLSLPLASLLPHQGVSWLVANTGKPIPDGAPAPAASPTVCPPDHAGWDLGKNLAFNTACGDWLDNVSGQLQWNNGDPHKTEVNWCNTSDESIVSAPSSGTDQVTETAEQLLPYCLAGIKAGGGP